MSLYQSSVWHHRNRQRIGMAINAACRVLWLKTISRNSQNIGYSLRFVSSEKRKKFIFDKFHKEKNPPTDIWAAVNDPKYTQTEEVTGHWHYVERLIPKFLPPEPPGHASVLGWKPPPAEAPDLPYFIERTRNLMLPVYLKKEILGPRYLTTIKKIQGDIWVLEKDLKEFLGKRHQKNIISQVEEVGCIVRVKGDYVEEVKEWLFDKGF